MVRHLQQALSSYKFLTHGGKFGRKRLEHWLWARLQQLLRLPVHLDCICQVVHTLLLVTKLSLFREEF